MTLSGSSWVARFPTSRSLDDLVQPFRDSVTRFKNALEAGGAVARISATLRPPERAYMMHFAWRISRENLDPKHVPAMDGVDIEWVHPTSGASRVAASAMVNGFEIVFRPALSSRHTEGRALDVTIGEYLNKTFQNASGESVTLKSSSDLHALGGTYGVIKLLSDPPHWSDDGH